MNLDLLLRLLGQPPEKWHFPPSDVFNETWMLRLFLSAIEELGNIGLPFAFQSGSKWLSEASLRSPFPSRKGVTIGEGSTSADALIGHFTKRPGTISGIQLEPDATQCVVLEAKMGSGLSKRTTYADEYDQAARTLACMAMELAQVDRNPADLSQFGFFLIAPDESRHTNDFLRILNPINLRNVITARYGAYAASSLTPPAMHQWWEEHAQTFLENLTESTVQMISWERCIEAVADFSPGVHEQLRAFYEECRRATGKLIVADSNSAE